MDFSFLGEAFAALAKDSPYVFILALFMLFAFVIIKIVINNAKSMYENAVKEISSSYATILDKTHETIKILNESLKKEINS